MDIDIISQLGAGSGINSRQVIDELVAAQREAQTVPLNDRLEVLSSRVDALGQLRGALEAISQTYQAMFPDGPAEGQGVLPGDALAALEMPVAVIWGAEDTVLPCPKPQALPVSFAFSVLPGLAHMLPEEAPDAVVRVLLGALGSDA